MLFVYATYRRSSLERTPVDGRNMFALYIIRINQCDLYLNNFERDYSVSVRMNYVHTCEILL